MTEDSPGAPRPGFTLDLSSGATGKPKRPKGFVPVVQKTINLTTKPRDEARGAQPAAPSAPAAPRQSEPRRDTPRAHRDDGHRGTGRRDETRRDDARPAGRSGGGTSLADLLDEATLARLRGGI